MDKELFDVKIDKRFFSVVSLSDQSDDKDYWFSRNPIERRRKNEGKKRRKKQEEKNNRVA